MIIQNLMKLCVFALCLPWGAVHAGCLKPYGGYTAGKGIDFDRGYATVGALALFDTRSKCSIFLPFVDGRGHILTNGRKGFNLGVGGRYLWATIEKIIGLNVYFDWTEGRKKNFQQAGIGVEFLGQNWEFRANGYFPFGKLEERGRTHVWAYKEGYKIKSTKFHRAMRGADAEIGWTIKQFNSFSNWGLYLAAGPYYYGSSEGKKQNAVGGKVRLSVQLFSFTALEAGFSRDQIFHDRYYGRFLVSLPLECLYSCEEIWKKITEIPSRNDFIVIHNHTKWHQNF